MNNNNNANILSGLDPNALQGIMQLAQKLAADTLRNHKTINGGDPQNMNMDVMVNQVSKTLMNPDTMKDVTRIMQGVQQQENASIEHYDNEEDTHMDDDKDKNAVLPATDDIYYTLNVKLEDIYTGKCKRLTLKRQQYKQKDDGSYETFMEKKTLKVPITPGIHSGETIVFPGEANHSPHHRPGNVIITIQEEEHPVFERDSDNKTLFCRCEISIGEVYKCCAKLTHLDGRVLQLNLQDHDVLLPDTPIRKLKGEGMPVYGEESKKECGDLYILFQVRWPDTLDDSIVTKLLELIPPEKNSFVGEENLPTKKKEAKGEEKKDDIHSVTLQKLNDSEIAKFRIYSDDEYSEDEDEIDLYSTSEDYSDENDEDEDDDEDNGVQRETEGEGEGEGEGTTENHEHTHITYDLQNDTPPKETVKKSQKEQKEKKARKEQKTQKV